MVRTSPQGDTATTGEERRERGYARPDLLIQTEELEARLGEPGLRIIDCHIFLELQPDGGYTFWSGRDAWTEGHIPGAVYVDLSDELAADHPYLRFMMPTADRFARFMSARGVGDRHEVVVYSRGVNYWATRLFFMFRTFGFDRVRVLDGGLDRWMMQGRPLTDVPPRHPPVTFRAIPRAGPIVGLDEVVAALDDPRTGLVNALAPDVYTGERLVPNYHRRGHIPGSVNIYAADLVDPDERTFKPAADLRRYFEETGALEPDRIIAYCGGGISATTDAFALLLLGHDDVAVYDGSLTEWGRDPDLPMEVGP